MTWLALADQETLDEMESSPETITDKETGVERGDTNKTRGGKGRVRRAVKWGSAVNWVGKERVKKSEVDGWCDDKGLVIQDQEEKTEFEEGARECWRRMEELRVEWEERLKKAGHDELS
jgi:3-keto steroid reductase